MLWVMPTKTIEKRLVEAVSHPLRHRAFTTFVERTASPNEIAQEAGEDVSLVAYHVGKLEDIGCIELVDTKQVRGATEHFYRAIQRPTVSNAEWAGMGPAEREDYSAWAVQLILSDIARSMAKGDFDRRDDRHLTRSLLSVDEQGWAELQEIFEEAFERVEGVAERTANRGGGDILVTAAMLLFER